MSGRVGPAELGKRVRKLRISNGLTQKELASPRYTAAYVSTIEAGKRTPSRNALQHFARKLGVDPEQIESGRPPDILARLQLRLHEARRALSQGAEDEAADAFRVVVRLAGRYRLPRIQARAEEGMGRTAQWSGNQEEAFQHFQKANALLEPDPAHLRADAVAGMARSIQMMGDVRYAIHMLETYLMLLERETLQDPVALMRIYSSLVWPYSEVGLYDKAAQVANEALRLVPRVDDAEQIANMHINVARELLRQARWDDALESLRRAEDIYRSLHWEVDVARAQLARGIVLADRGDFAAARDELLPALDIFRAASAGLHEARALNELARVERELGSNDEAERLLLDAVSILRDVDVAELALAHRQLGLCYVDTKPELAEKNFRLAIDLYRRAEEPLQVANTYRDLGDLLSDQGDVDACRAAYREGLVALGDASR
ncbi:MAG: tetratricopeptide repeat protein [Actinomycetota bacterium]